MKRVKLVVAYDGTNYCGWQVQKNGETIESVLNRAIGELTGEEIHVMGSSRTDAGVHACGNVRSLTLKRGWPQINFHMH